MRRMLGLFAFAITGGTLLLLSILRQITLSRSTLIIFIVLFFLFGLAQYWRELKNQEKEQLVFSKTEIIMILCTFFSVVLTWFMNHYMGYGAVISSGIVGLLAAALLPPSLAGLVYTASFVGMAGTNMVPSLWTAGLGGIVVGIISILTKEIYGGLGGKGGTTAALSTLVTKAIINLFS